MKNGLIETRFLPVSSRVGAVAAVALMFPATIQLAPDYSCESPSTKLFRDRLR